MVKVLSQFGPAPGSINVVTGDVMGILVSLLLLPDMYWNSFQNIADEALSLDMLFIWVLTHFWAGYSRSS